MILSKYFFISSFRKQYSKLIVLAVGIFLGLLNLSITLIIADNISNYLDGKSKELLNGDGRVSSNYSFDQDLLNIFSNIGEKVVISDIIETNSMISSNNEDYILSELKIVDENYPLYGDVVLIDGSKYQTPGYNEIYLDKNSAQENKIQKNDTLKVGYSDFLVKNIYDKAPDERPSLVDFGGGIIMSKEGFDYSKLEKDGSRIRYKKSYKITNEFFAEDIKNILEQYKKSNSSISFRTFDEEEGYGERVTGWLKKYLVSMSFLSIFLCIAVIISTYKDLIDRRQKDFGILRCLGLNMKKIKLYMLSNVAVIALLSSSLSYFVALFLSDQISKILLIKTGIEMNINFNLFLFIEIVILGVLISLLSSYFPIDLIKNIRPINVLRGTIPNIFSYIKKEDYLKFFAFNIILACLISFLIKSFYIGFLTIAVFYLVILMLATIYYFSFTLLSKLSDKTRSFFLRIPLSSLRYNTKSQAFISSLIALSVTIIGLVLLIGINLENKISIDSSEKFPSIVAIDVQNDQITDLKDMYAKDIKIYPMIRARVFSIDGKVIDRESKDLPEDLGREFNISYRDYLEDYEKVSEGVFWGSSYTNKYELSVDEERAKTYDIKIGSEITFDIQGLKVDTYVTNLREVGKNEGTPFFYFLFTEKLGIEAPNSNFAFIYREESENKSIKKRLIDKFPNISVIEGNSVRDNILEISNQAKYAIIAIMISILILGLAIMINLFFTMINNKERRNVLLCLLGLQNFKIRILSTIELSISILVSLIISFLFSIVLGYFLLIFYFDIVSFFIPMSMFYLYLGIVFITLVSSFIAVSKISSPELSEKIKLLSN